MGAEPFGRVLRVYPGQPTFWLKMTKVDLRQVTLVMVETQRHLLARLAVEDCLQHAEFGDVVICTDQFSELKTAGATYQHVPDFPTKREYCEYIWYGVPSLVQTPYALLIQWDSWILDPVAWRSDFLAFDYIGAPWWFKDGLNVGNSGFNIRSKRLMDFLVQRREYFPMRHPEDEVLCRRYRRAIEEEGSFSWAPEPVALDFAFEYGHYPPTTPFGFHGIFNWPRVLEYARLMERVRIAERSDYIRDVGLLEKITQCAPWMTEHLLYSSKSQSDKMLTPIFGTAYRGVLQTFLLEHKLLAHGARDDKSQVKIAVLIDRKGDLRDCKVVSSSGIPKLDCAALLMAQRASPFPKPPNGEPLKFTTEVAPELGNRCSTLTQGNRL